MSPARRMANIAPQGITCFSFGMARAFLGGGMLSGLVGGERCAATAQPSPPPVGREYHCRAVWVYSGTGSDPDGTDQSVLWSIPGRDSRARAQSRPIPEAVRITAGSSVQYMYCQQTTRAYDPKRQTRTITQFSLCRLTSHYRHRRLRELLCRVAGFVYATVTAGNRGSAARGR